MFLNATIVGLTVRQALAKRRWLFVTLLALAPVLVSVIDRTYRSPTDDGWEMIANVFPVLVMSIVVPLVALLLASSAFGAEVEDGTVIYSLTKPIPRSQIVLSKLLVICVVCAVLVVASTLAAGYVTLGRFDDTRLIVGFAAAAALGSVLYSALFLSLGLITRRGLLIGLAYLIVWEGALAGVFTGIHVLSVRQYMLSIADAITTVEPDVFVASLAQSRAYWMSAIVFALATALCVYRLRNFEIGETS